MAEQYVSQQNQGIIATIHSKTIADKNIPIYKHYFFYLNSTKRIYVRPRPVVSHPNN
jgi:hypothetical protein